LAGKQIDLTIPSVTAQCQQFLPDFHCVESAPHEIAGYQQPCLSHCSKVIIINTVEDITITYESLECTEHSRLCPLDLHAVGPKLL